MSTSFHAHVQQFKLGMPYEHGYSQLRLPGNIAALKPVDYDALVLAHLPQVRLVARSMRERTRFSVELDDLVSFGTLGLLDAVKKFDPGRGIFLRTYAEHRIRGAMLDGLRSMDWLSRSARQMVKSSGWTGNWQVAQPRSTELPAYDEWKIPARSVTSIGGGSVFEIERLSQYSRRFVGLSMHEPTPEKLLEHKQERTALAQAINGLPERQKNVLDLYYRRELNMKQIAALLGVHESRVSQIHLAAIARLRKILRPNLVNPVISSSKLSANAPVSNQPIGTRLPCSTTWAMAG